MFKITIWLLLVCSFVFGNAQLLSQASDYENKKDYHQAFIVYAKLAKSNNDVGLLKLGEYYYYGFGVVSKDYKKAMQYFKKSYELGNRQALYNLAIALANSKNEFHDFDKAYSMFKELSVDGHAGAQHKMGLCYLYGVGIAMDYKEAIKWFETSAKQGFESAECHLAYMYASGKGVPVNLGRAHSFAQNGYFNGNSICKSAWEQFGLAKHPIDRGTIVKGQFIEPIKKN